MHLTRQQFEDGRSGFTFDAAIAEINAKGYLYHATGLLSPQEPEEMRREYRTALGELCDLGAACR